MKFLVRMTYEKEDYDAFARLSAKVLARGRTIATRLFCILVAAVCVCMAAYITLEGGGRSSSFAWVMAVGAVIFLSMAAFLPLYQAWMLRRRQPAEVKETVYTFKERTFSVESGAGEHEYAYASLVQVYESEGYFFLMMSKKSALVLPKRSFVSGTPKGMREFLEQKTDGKVVRLSL